MTNWQITAKTIYCDSMKSEVTIIVKKDWSIQCTGHDGYQEQNGKSAGTCEGLKCSRIDKYMAQLKQEENS